MVHYLTEADLPETVDCLAFDVAEQAIGSALDNGHDMAATDPEGHLATEWRGYIRREADEFVEEGCPVPIDLPIGLRVALAEGIAARAEAVAPTLAAQHDRTLYVPVDEDEDGEGGR